MPFREARITSHPVEPNRDRAARCKGSAERFAAHQEVQRRLADATIPQFRPVAWRAAPAVAQRPLLERLLAFAGNTVSAKPLARRFPSLGHVLSAEPVQLAPYGIGPRELALFELVKAAARDLARAEVRLRPVINNWQALIDYCTTLLAYGQVEELHILYLDAKLMLIADETVAHGTADHVYIHPREIAKRALLHNALSVILVHNHPTGHPKPSRGDIEMTQRVNDALKALDISLNDHLVVGHGGHASFRSLGLL